MCVLLHDTAVVVCISYIYILYEHSCKKLLLSSRYGGEIRLGFTTSQHESSFVCSSIFAAAAILRKKKYEIETTTRMNVCSGMYMVQQTILYEVATDAART